MANSTGLGIIAGLIVGGVGVALLHAYPKDVVTLHRYCQECAVYEETYDEGVILGGVHSSSSGMTGPLSHLLAHQVGDHTHRFTEWATIFPTFGAPEQHPEVARKVMELHAIEDNPFVMSGLVAAMQADKPRTQQLLLNILDPRGPSPEVLAPLQNPGTPADHLAQVDAKILADAKK